MKVVVLHNEVDRDALADERDVLVQVRAVADALRHLGHEVATLGVSLDLSRLQADLQRLGADLVFNLVETLAGDTRIGAMVPALLERWGVPFTGNSAAAIFLTTDKVATKDSLRAFDLPTPRRWLVGETAPPPGLRVIVKPMWEDASLGIDGEAVIDTRGEDVEGLLARAGATVPSFVEEFVAGREVNVSLIGPLGRPEVLPVAEIMFVGFPKGTPRIVGYRAKWDDTAPEYHGTFRRMLDEDEGALSEEVSAIAIACFERLRLSGYARVDFRVGATGPTVLEVNANPCLTPGAGFAGSAEHAGLSYAETVGRIIAATEG